MFLKTLMFAAAGLLLLAGVAEAQQRPVLLKAPPPGQTEFPACCEYCPAGGCTGCNAGPEGLNCGSGLIKAECTMKNDVTTCKKAELNVKPAGSGKLKSSP
ncbi:MAG: hypothetical protein Kow00114_25750 [Kiloniellaceae bacterium]